VEYIRYVAVLRRHALMIILLTLLGAGSSAFFSLRQHKVYRATTTLSINPAAPSQAVLYLQQMVNGGYNAMGQLASSYDAFLHLPSFSAAVTTRAGIKLTPEQITTDLVGNTPYFHINVIAGSAPAARILADMAANEFINENDNIQVSPQDKALQRQSTQMAVRVQAQIDKVMHDSDKLESQIKGDASASQQQARAALATQLSNLLTTQKALAQSGGTPVQYNTATIVAHADLPRVPISPQVRQNIIFGTAAGVAIGLLLAFLLDYLDYSLRSPEDVEAATGQLPLAVIGMIGARRAGRRPSSTQGPSRLPVTELQPLTGGGPRNGNGSAVPAPALVTVQHPLDPVSEAFRSLRTNLAFSTLAKPARTLVVTSVLPSEGKSTTAANLAVVLAQSGKRVIIVDTDLRRPSVHRIFNVRNTNGFTDLLLASASIADSLQPTAVPNLWVITSGPLPPNPAELLSSEAVSPLISSLSAHADIVLFDTPPMGVITDAVVLSTRVEGTLMVVRSGSARPAVVTKGLEALRKVGARPLGVVLNMVDVSSLRDYSYYYYYSQTGDYGKAQTPSQVGSVGS